MPYAFTNTNYSIVATINSTTDGSAFEVYTNKLSDGKNFEIRLGLTSNTNPVKQERAIDWIAIGC